MTKYLLSLTLLFSLFLMQCKNKEDFRDSGVAEFKGKILNPGAPGLTVEINGVIKEIPISPVSYTHLDVYKRQAIHSNLNVKNLEDSK